MSRGRGIKIYKTIENIIDHLLIYPNSFIIQKYIEKPLLIKKRKVNQIKLSLI